MHCVRALVDYFSFAHALNCAFARSLLIGAFTVPFESFVSSAIELLLGANAFGSQFVHMCVRVWYCSLCKRSFNQSAITQNTAYDAKKL